MSLSYLEYDRLVENYRTLLALARQLRWFEKEYERTKSTDALARVYEHARRVDKFIALEGSENFIEPEDSEDFIAGLREGTTDL